MSKAFFWIRLSLTGYVSLVEQKVGVMNHPQESFWCEAVNLRNFIGFSIIFTIHFGFFPPIFGSTPTLWRDLMTDTLKRNVEPTPFFNSTSPEGTDVVSVNLDQFVQRSVGALREGRPAEEMLVGKSLNLGTVDIFGDSKNDTKIVLHYM